jgi:hypothetical protein
MLEMSKVVPQIVRKFDIEIEGEWRLKNRWFVKPQDFAGKIRPRVLN